MKNVVLRPFFFTFFPFPDQKSPVSTTYPIWTLFAPLPSLLGWYFFCLSSLADPDPCQVFPYKHKYFVPEYKALMWPWSKSGSDAHFIRVRISFFSVHINVCFLNLRRILFPGREKRKNFSLGPYWHLSRINMLFFGNFFRVRINIFSGSGTPWT